LKIIVYEHVSGGGYAGQPIPPSVLSEGFGMLRSIVADFKAAGHEVTVLMDARLSKLNPPIDADCRVPIFYSHEPGSFLNNIAKINDAIYVIAPETGQTLQSLVELAEQLGKTSLNCESEAIGKVADKAVLYETLQKNSFSTPKTLSLNNTDSLAQEKQAIKRELNYPAIFKPVDGVGCGGLSIVKEEAQIQKAIAKIKAESKSTRFIAQEFIMGESASVSLLCTGKKALAVSLNRQNVTIAEPDMDSSYNGGCVPFEHPLKQEAFALAEKVVESFRGLRGYVGVDLVLAGQKAIVVDVNPRLTTSYVGLRKVASFNIAEALVNAVLKSKLPTKPENRGNVCFSKIETSTPTIDAFQKAAKLDAAISPPFPLEDNTKSYTLIIGDADTLDDAKLHLEEAKKHLRNIIT
jgi:predicted ATP-grasp superfamily ATP-dependent carboligase